MRCGWTISNLRQKSISLPSIYGLSLPPGGLVVPGQDQRISAGRPLPDSDDPVQIVSPFDVVIGIVAEAASVPKLNMCQRVVELMEQLAPRETWSAEAERNLRSNLDSIGLRLSFTRPRARIARRGMFHAVAELIDAGQLAEDQIDRLEAVLRTYDPQMVLIEPGPRPLEISPVSGLTDYGVANEEWLEGVDGTTESAAWQPAGGRVVLAEETKLKHLGGWESPMEVRRSVVHLGQIGFPANRDSEEFFSKTINGLVDEYPTLRSNSEEPPIVVRHVSYGYDSPGENWLALNPEIGHKLGWRLSDEGLFRWIDDEAEIMVESIWWSDGLLGQSPLHFDIEVGEGWIVLASRRAWGALQYDLGTLMRSAHIEREFYKDGQSLKRAAVSVKSV